MKNLRKNKIENKLYWTITIFTLIFLVVVLVTVNRENRVVTTGELDTWLVIAGGVISLFTVIAFLNMYIGKEDFRVLEERLVKKNDEEIATIKAELETSISVLNSMRNRMDDYQTIMDSNTLFIMDYTQYLSSNPWHYSELLNKFISHFENNNNAKVSCAAIIDLSEKEIEQSITSGSGIILDYSTNSNRIFLYILNDIR
ncbi:hypothetical protein [Erysipelothrix aquatica]|uniref:hypothetical protein n=1 Tax=Erysipelothrix aquatica TaxID=2683714 RepID=UPI00135A7375|nr:hypothetical protein [Erysipelothrix aquatica]